MSTLVQSTNQILATEEEVALARDVLAQLAGPQGELLVSEPAHEAQPVPVEIGRMLQRVLEALADGSSVTVLTIPSEVTTSAAAAMLGVSRPTLVKLAKNGRIPSHRVGSHLRFRSQDVLAERCARVERERRSFEDLRALDV